MSICLLKIIYEVLKIILSSLGKKRSPMLQQVSEGGFGYKDLTVWKRKRVGCFRRTHGKQMEPEDGGHRR